MPDDRGTEASARAGALSRRAAVGRLAAGALLLPALPRLLAALAPTTHRAAPLRLLLLLPADAPAALTAAVRDGATMGAEEAQRAATLLGASVELVTESLPADAAATARRVRDAGAGALLGGLDEADALLLAAAAEAAAIPFLNVAAASDELRGARCGAHLFHVAPSHAMRLDAALLWLAGRDDAARWQLVLPSGAAGDRLRDRVRTRAANDAPVLAAALDAAGGAARLVIEAAGDETATDAASVVVWHHALERYGAAQVNDRFGARFGRAMPEAAWPAWVAAKIAWEAASGPRAALPPPRRLAAAGARYDGHKGRPLDFRPWDHQLRQPLYVATSGPDGRPRLASVPPDGGETPSRTVLDRLGATAAESACRMGGG